MNDENTLSFVSPVAQQRGVAVETSHFIAVATNTLRHRTVDKSTAGEISLKISESHPRDVRWKRSR